jgi:CDP-diacylglycerol--glycerol-3-phosphate 3-phosphatidyltransferase
VSILIDALRGTREAPHDCAASLLVPLVAQFGDRVDVRLYHTPNFRGIKKRFVPQRFNEGWGLQHIKLYGMDDELILSGYSSPFQIGVNWEGELEQRLFHPSAGSISSVQVEGVD